MALSLLIIVNDPYYFLSHRLPIAQEAKEKGYEVSVAGVNGASVQKILDLGFKYYPLPLSRGGKNPFVELWAFLRIYGLLRNVRPDILHLVTTKPVLYGGIASRLASISGVVSAVAGLGSIFIAQGFKAKLIRFLVTQLYRLALGHPNSVVIFQNPDDRAVLIGSKATGIDKCILIRGSGVTLDNYQVFPEPEGRLVVTFAGRLIRDKGVFEFIEAAESLRAKGLDAKFQLVGDIDPANPSSLSAREVERLRYEGNIDVLGYCENLAAVFKSSNLVVLPSYREGLPKVLIEAAACGRAVITTNVPGCRDAIEDGVTGVLVAVKDSFSLAQAIEMLAAQPDVRKRMGRSGRQLAEKAFAIKSVVDIHMSIYERLAGGRNFG
ncbi:glycosyltransferase family 4 protein [Phytopseudomonas daroniae]|uniref:glycosyltransferase family 4 protein n=1 Tax=Phytopseudomonas daroniae TaxID=2487519 RepID=UPI0010382F73|nr:glycosyltransferase family 4 protein [Pseudomonas daroniae]TBU74532.1 glycosyltransferase family 1 protein [Pseudomonas daroniae]